MNIKDALALSRRLQETSESPRLDAELLLCHVLAKPRSYLLAWSDAILDEDQYQQYEELLERRAAGEPVAHLIGSQGFWTLDLEVTKDTLIPRPETELLIEVVLTLPVAERARVADLGTGTGAIALALASEQPGWQVTGCDRVIEAVELAERNRERLGNSQCWICAR